MCRETSDRNLLLVVALPVLLIFAIALGPVILGLLCAVGCGPWSSRSGTWRSGSACSAAARSAQPRGTPTENRARAAAGRRRASTTARFRPSRLPPRAPLLPPARPQSRPAAARTSTGAPPIGCGKARRAACRNCRRRPKRTGPPYSRSPITGWPIAAMWTRSGGCGRCRARPRAGSRRDTRGRPEMGCRRPRPVAVERVDHPLAPVAADRRVDRPGPRRRQPATSARYCGGARAGSRSRERAVDRIGLGDDEQPRGVPVEPVDDPGAPRVLAAGRAVRRAPARASRSDARAPGARRRPPGLSTTSRYSSS